MGESGRERAGEVEQMRMRVAEEDKRESEREREGERDREWMRERAG